MGINIFFFYDLMERVGVFLSCELLSLEEELDQDTRGFFWCYKTLLVYEEGSQEVLFQQTEWKKQDTISPLAASWTLV